MQTFSFTFSHVPTVFQRKHHVLLALFDEENRLYLSRKHIYPANIYRLFGGGVDGDEASLDAAVRELEEETGLHTPPELHETFHFSFTEESTNKRYEMQFDLYYVQVHRQRVVPGDDVQGMRIFSPEDVPVLLEDMNDLSTTIVSGKNGEHFSWADWGKPFSIMQQYVLDHWPNN